MDWADSSPAPLSSSSVSPLFSSLSLYLPLGLPSYLSMYRCMRCQFSTGHGAACILASSISVAIYP